MSYTHITIIARNWNQSTPYDLEIFVMREGHHATLDSGDAHMDISEGTPCLFNRLLLYYTLFRLSTYLRCHHLPIGDCLKSTMVYHIHLGQFKMCLMGACLHQNLLQDISPGFNLFLRIQFPF